MGPDAATNVAATRPDAPALPAGDAAPALPAGSGTTDNGDRPPLPSRPVVRRPDDVDTEPPGEHDTHGGAPRRRVDRKSTRLNSSHANTSHAVFCLKKKITKSSSASKHK